MPYAHRWPRKIESLLINYLSKHPSYWDNTHADFYNRVKRRQVLVGAKVALADAGFNIDVHSISRKFKNLRTIFIKEYKKAHAKSASCDKVYEPIWEHYDHLLFLRDASQVKVCQERIASKHNLNDEEEYDIDSLQDVIEVDQMSDLLKVEEDGGKEQTRRQRKNVQEAVIEIDSDHRESTNSTLPGPSKPKESPNRRKRRNSAFDGEISPIVVKSGTGSDCSRKEGCTQVSLGQDDDPAAFGVLVAHKLRCLSKRNAMMAQSDIIAVLHKYVLAEIDPS